MRIAFFRALHAFPATSPSTPNSMDNKRECFLLFICSMSALRIACKGVIRLIFLAGIHADIRTVSAEVRNAAANTAGLNRKTAVLLAETSAIITLVSEINPISASVPDTPPTNIGSNERTAASCKRQTLICAGVAPMLISMPSWWILACMDTSKEPRIIKIREIAVKSIMPANNIGSNAMESASLPVCMALPSKSLVSIS